MENNLQTAFNAEGHLVGASLQALIEIMTCHEDSPGKRYVKKMKAIQWFYLTTFFFILCRSTLFTILLLQLSTVYESGNTCKATHGSIQVGTTGAP